MVSPGYLRYPHVHGELLTFVAEDDIWLVEVLNTPDDWAAGLDPSRRP